MSKNVALLLVLVFLAASSMVAFLPVKANPYMYYEIVYDACHAHKPYDV
jgi:hypothetical protein